MGCPLTLFIADSRERVDQVMREKEKLRSDLDKAEKLKSLMASEVDDHHAAIERRNEYNLRWDTTQRASPPLVTPAHCRGACSCRARTAGGAQPAWPHLGLAQVLSP